MKMCSAVLLLLIRSLLVVCNPLLNETEVDTAAAKSHIHQKRAFTASCHVLNCIRCSAGRCIQCISSCTLFNGNCYVPDEDDLHYLVSHLRIDDSSISASSEFASNYGAHRVRIDQYFDPPCSWSAGRGDNTPWVQFDMGADVTVWGTIIKTRCDHDQRVTLFQVTRSDDGLIWCDACRPIRATYSADGSFTAWFREAVTARYWKINVLDWKVHPSMKADIIGHAYTAQSSKSRNCRDLLSLGFTDSGVYTVHAGPYLKPIKVYCDQETDGGGWLVFQRRHDGVENFYRNWTDYENGFGDLYGEFWLGTHSLSLLSEQDDYMLRVDLEDFTGATVYARYSHFSVAEPLLSYGLSVGGYEQDSTAGDSLSAHTGIEFSTYDKDNDASSSLNCAAELRGGWWYKSCASSNLNGAYLGEHDSSGWAGVRWDEWRGGRYSLKTTEMKIRPF